MQLNIIDHEELQEIIYKLDQALYNHQQWYDSIIRTMTCRSPADKRDIRVNAHKECRFGQWYYESAPKKLRKHPGFKALSKEHQLMHKAATKLLITIEHGSTVSSYDFDQFANCLEKVRLELSTLKRELCELLYNRDALTGAINRVNMLPFLRDQQELVKRTNQECCISMMDLDHFKQINDEYGHTAGDFVLTGITHYLIQNLRLFDKIFRVGGEEFLLCLANVTMKQAYEMIERLRKGVAKTAISISKNKLVSVTASFGLDSITKDVSVEQSIRHADQALYKAKKEGRNCARIYSKEAKIT